MKVAIYGAGAMGTVLGAYISKAGYEIDLINHNKLHVEALKKNGAKIIGMVNFTQKVNALLPEEMNTKYDIILLMTKQLNNKKIVQSILPFINENGIICTMQNGLPELSVSKVIGEERTFGCAMSWGATLIEPGVSELTSEPNRESLTFSIGKYGNNDEEMFNYVVKLLNVMGNVTVEKNFIGARWSKLLVNAAFSGLSVVSGGTFGEICDNKFARRLAQKVMKECIEVCRKGNIKIEPIQGKDIVKLMDYNSGIKKWISFHLIPLAMRKHRKIKSSMIRDINRGRKCEIEAINGVVCEYGIKVGVKTPVNDKIVEVTHMIENGDFSISWKNLTLFEMLIQ